MLRGDRLDTTMNYRLRDAVLGLLAPGSFDSKGFADSGRVIEPSEFAARLASIREDYPDAAYYSLMNLLDSHDTERLLWTLTPGAETSAGEGAQRRQRGRGQAPRCSWRRSSSSRVPGAPTVYYGDEVGMTGDDDPDDRRTYPWADLGGTPDTACSRTTRRSPALRAGNAALDRRRLPRAAGRRRRRHGRLRPQDRRAGRDRRDQPQRAARRRSTIPVAGYVPDGTAFTVAYGVGDPRPARVTVSDGVLELSLPAVSGAAARRPARSTSRRRRAREPGA